MIFMNPLFLLTSAIALVLDGIASKAEIEAAVRHALREEKLVEHSCQSREDLERENCRIYLGGLMKHKAVLLEQLAVSRCESLVIRIAFEQAINKAVTSENEIQMVHAIGKVEELGTLLQQNTLKYVALIGFQEKGRLS